MFDQQTLIIIFAVVLAFSILMENRSNGGTTEGYSTSRNVYNGYGKISPYYAWRTYGHRSDPGDYGRYDAYPYDYQPQPHPPRVGKYCPYFYKYGYGSL